MLLPPEEGKAYEQAWVKQEGEEVPGFEDFYWQLRDKFDLDSSMTETDRRALAEQIYQYAKGQLSCPSPQELYQQKTLDKFDLDSLALTDIDVEVFIKQVCQCISQDLNQWLEEQLSAKTGGLVPPLAYKIDYDPRRSEVSIRWPRLLRQEIYQGIPQLLVTNDVAAYRPKAARISIPEVMQWFMTFGAKIKERENSFTGNDAIWLQGVAFSLEMGDGFASPRITVADATRYLRTLPAMIQSQHIRKADGSCISPSKDRTLEDRLIVHYMCCYTIFLESLRQQVCTGVGLCCPFWKGAGCCEFRPLLQRTYDVAKPWKKDWKRHWQKPPCLG
jgi:hypothetical protein